MLVLSGTVLLTFLVYFIILWCFLIPIDFLDGCISFLWVSTYVYLFSHQVLIHPFVESATCSLRHIFASSPLGSEENSLAGLHLPEHYISSVVWRIGQSIRALRSFGGHRVLCDLCFVTVLHLWYQHSVNSSCSWCCQFSNVFYLLT